MIDHQGRAQISDFDLAITGEITRGEVSGWKRNPGGSVGWQAPEQFKYVKEARQRPVDVYAYACICYLVSCVIIEQSFACTHQL